MCSKWGRESAVVPRVGWSVLGAVIFVTACGSDLQTASTIPGGSNLANHLTSSVISRLTSDGRFSYVDPPGAPGEMITHAVAGEQARLFARQFLPYSRDFAERQHGGPIDFEALSVGDVYLAWSNDDEVAVAADAPLSSPQRKMRGPYYLVQLTDGNSAVLSIAVSALNTDISVVNGNLQFPTHYGNDFLWSGVPVEYAEGIPKSPEAAVIALSGRAGALVEAVPELLLPERPLSPHFARWRITFDREVFVKSLTANEEFLARELFLDYAGDVFVSRESSDRIGGAVATFERVGLSRP